MRDLNQHLLKEEILIAMSTREDAQSHCHQGNANINHNWILLHTQQNGYNERYNIKYWRGCGATGTLIYHWWGFKWFWETTWQFLLKQNICQPMYDPAIPLFGTYPKKYVHQHIGELAGSASSENL